MENHLSKVQGPDYSEVYYYDPDGMRIKKVSGDTTWYYPFPFYEVKVVTDGNAAAADKHIATDTGAYGNIINGDTSRCR